jgi:hypothetical protein
MTIRSRFKLVFLTGAICAAGVREIKTWGRLLITNQQMAATVGQRTGRLSVYMGAVATGDGVAKAVSI